MILPPNTAHCTVPRDELTTPSGSLHNDDMPSEQKRCPECDAPTTRGLSCWEQLGMLLAWERGRAGERYILNGQNVTVAAFFQRLSRLSGVAAPMLRMPGSRPLAVGIGKLFTRAVRAIGGEPPVDEVSIEMGQYFWYCDGGKAERELGFSPRDPGETLRDTVNDLVARKVVFPKRSSRIDVAQRPGQ